MKLQQGNRGIVEYMAKVKQLKAIVPKEMDQIIQDAISTVKDAYYAIGNGLSPFEETRTAEVLKDKHISSNQEFYSELVNTLKTISFNILGNQGSPVAPKTGNNQISFERRTKTRKGLENADLPHGSIHISTAVRRATFPTNVITHHCHPMKDNEYRIKRHKRV
ncbi:hypothetical protein RUND412_007413 [Rhizina undulata]